MDSEFKQYVLEYLRALELHRTEELLEEEALRVEGKCEKESSLLGMFKNSNGKSRKENLIKKEIKEQEKKYQQILQAGRQIFSVSISLLQMLHSIKEASTNESILDSMESYKIQLGKHHKTIINEGNPEGADLISDSVIMSHKLNLEKYVREGNTEKQVEVFLSLRINALQIAPELRKTLVLQLIRKDIIKVSTGFEFIDSILNNVNKAVRHAVLSLLSVIASSTKGVEYLTQGGNTIIIRKIITIMKEQENGNISQRFALAILQKSSILEPVIQTLLENQVIQWVLVLLKRSFIIDINSFCLDFATALLANIMHSRVAQRHFQAHPEFTLHLVQTLLRFIQEKMQVSVLMHLLICLNYIYKDPFKPMLNEVGFKERVNQFARVYKDIGMGSSASEIDKKTVLDLCGHIFHSKGKEEPQEIRRQAMEQENDQNELIFECFQDEMTS